MPASALTIWVDTDRVIDTTRYDDFMIGWHSAADQAAQNNPSSPSFTVSSTGQIVGSVFAFNSSAVTVAGGDGGGINLHDTSSLTINGGTANVSAGDNSTVMVTDAALHNYTVGGSATTQILDSELEQTISLSGSSINTITNTTIGNDTMFSSSDVFVDAAASLTAGNLTVARNIRLEDNSQLVATATTLGGDLNLFNSASSSFGGQIAGSAIARDSAMLSLDAVEIGLDLSILDNASVPQLTGVNLQRFLTINTPTESHLSGVTVGNRATIVKASVDAGDFTVTNGVTVSDGATLAVSGADFGSLTGSGAITIELNDGIVHGTLSAAGISSLQAASVTMQNGMVNLVAASGFSLFQLNGGGVTTNVNATSNSLLFLNGIVVGDSVNVSGSSETEMSAGGIANDFLASGSAMVNLTGGTINRDLLVGGKSYVTLAGTHVVGDAVTSGGTLEVSGGSTTGDVLSTTGGYARLYSGNVGGHVHADAGGLIDQLAGTFDDPLVTNGGVYVIIGGTINGNVTDEGGTAGGAGFGVGGNGVVNGSIIFEYSGSFGMWGGSVQNVQLTAGQADILGGTITGNLELIGGSGHFEDDAAVIQGNLRLIGAQVDLFSETVVHGGVLIDGEGALINQYNGTLNNVTLQYGGRLEMLDTPAHVIDLVARQQSFVHATAGSIDGEISVDHSTFELTDAVFNGNLTATHADVTLIHVNASGTITATDISKLNLDLVDNHNLPINADRSEVTLYRSHVGAVNITDHGKITMSTSAVHGPLSVEYHAIATLGNGGTIYGQFLVTESQARVAGVVTSDLWLKGRSTVHMSAGRVEGNAYVTDLSKFRMTGGTINGVLVVSDQARADLIAGTIGSLVVNPPAGMGAGFEGPLPSGFTGIIAVDDAVINIHGTELVANLVDPNYDSGAFSLYQFSGFLSDGSFISAVNLLIQNGSAASFQFLPPALAGDYNDNGVIDAADYTLWRDHLGDEFTLDNENPLATTPGVVDQEDYDFWKEQFGLLPGGGSSGAATAAAPEPATFWILVPAILVMCSRPRRPHH